jgi:hypothetical protein
MVYMIWRHDSWDFFTLAIFGLVLVTTVLSLIRRERIEIYSERMVWRRTYFAITRSTESPVDEVLGAEWREGDDRGESKGPTYLEFFLPGNSVKAGFGLTFEDFRSHARRHPHDVPPTDQSLGNILRSLKRLHLTEPEITETHS